MCCVCGRLSGKQHQISCSKLLHQLLVFYATCQVRNLPGSDFSSIVTVKHNCGLKQIHLKMFFFAFHKVVQRHYSGEVDEFTIF